VWPNKLEYSITTPTRAVIFGTSLRVDFRLAPLLKGLKIGTVTSQLIESHDFTLNSKDLDPLQNNYKTTRLVTFDMYTLSEEDRAGILNNEEVDGYQFSRTLDLPKTLRKCMQDTDTEGVKIKHKLKFRLQLHNPDGHTSEVL
jgi:arrestin-related trafficking adapter 4/5/7